MGKFKWLGAILAAVSLVLIAVTLDGGTALGRQAEPSQPPLISVGLALPPAGTDFLDFETCFSNVKVDGIDKLGTCLTGVGEVERKDAVFDTIDIEIVQMQLVGSINGLSVTMFVGVDNGLAASTGTMQEQTPGSGGPFDLEMNVFYELKCGVLLNADCCLDAPACFSLKNCGAVASTWTGTPDAIPAVGFYTAANSSACDVLLNPRITGETPETTVNAVSVGGIAERLGTSAGPDSSLDSSSGSVLSYVALGGALAAAAVAVAVGGWYARRRWLT